MTYRMMNLYRNSQLGTGATLAWDPEGRHTDTDFKTALWQFRRNVEKHGDDETCRTMGGL